MRIVKSFFALLALVALIALVPTARASESDFNGSWDLQVHGGPSQANFSAAKAWWLSVSGAGTPEMKIQYVGTPDGSLDDITESSFQNGVLHYTWKSRNGDEHIDYVVKYVNGHLEGSVVSPRGGATVTFTGIRVPKIDQHDDGTWVEGKPIKLFDGKDLKGWTGVLDDKATGWSVNDGILEVRGTANPRNEDLKTVAKYWNYELHIEYKLCPKGNSGVALRGRYEVQMADDYGKPAGMHSTGALYTRILPAMNASKPAGEWNTYDIRLVGLEVTTTLNGQKLYDKGVITGLTGMASDPFEGKPGPIELQGAEMRAGVGPIQFRNIVLTPLTKSHGMKGN